MEKERHQGHAHNTYMQMLAESGAVGLAALCTMLLSVLIFGWKNRKSVFGVAIMASGMAFILYGITDHTNINYGSLRVLWLMVGCCAAYIKLDNLG